MPTQAEVKAKLDEITAGVQSLSDPVASLEQLITNQASQIANLKAAAENSPAVIPPEFMAQLEAIEAALTVHKDRIVADVTANTLIGR